MSEVAPNNPENLKVTPEIQAELGKSGNRAVAAMLEAAAEGAEVEGLDDKPEEKLVLDPNQERAEIFKQKEAELEAVKKRVEDLRKENEELAKRIEEVKQRNEELKQRIEEIKQRRTSQNQPEGEIAALPPAENSENGGETGEIEDSDEPEDHEPENHEDSDAQESAEAQDDTGNSSEDSESVGDLEDSENSENPDEADNPENGGETGAIEDSEDSENHEDFESPEAKAKYEAFMEGGVGKKTKRLRAAICAGIIVMGFVFSLIASMRSNGAQLNNYNDVNNDVSGNGTNITETVNLDNFSILNARLDELTGGGDDDKSGGGDDDKSEKITGYDAGIGAENVRKITAAQNLATRHESGNTPDSMYESISNYGGEQGELIVDANGVVTVNNIGDEAYFASAEDKASGIKNTEGRGKDVIVGSAAKTLAERLGIAESEVTTQQLADFIVETRATDVDAANSLIGWFINQGGASRDLAKKYGFDTDNTTIDNQKEQDNFLNMLADFQENSEFSQTTLKGYCKFEAKGIKEIDSSEIAMYIKRANRSEDVIKAVYTDPETGKTFLVYFEKDCTQLIEQEQTKTTTAAKKSATTTQKVTPPTETKQEEVAPTPTPVEETEEQLTPAENKYPYSDKPVYVTPNGGGGGGKPEGPGGSSSSGSSSSSSEKNVKDPTDDPVSTTNKSGVSNAEVGGGENTDTSGAGTYQEDISGSDTQGGSSTSVENSQYQPEDPSSGSSSSESSKSDSSSGSSGSSVGESADSTPDIVSNPIDDSSTEYSGGDKGDSHDTAADASAVTGDSINDEADGGEMAMPD